MFDRILKRMRELVRTRQYVMTAHAEDEMDADDLTIYDVESVILVRPNRQAGFHHGIP